MEIIIIVILLTSIAFYIKMEKEYDPENKDRLIDYTVWGTPNSKSQLIQNKNNSIMKILRFKGFDYESSTPAELDYLRANINNILKRLDEGYVLQVEARRKRVTEYPNSTFKEKLLQQMDNIRKKKVMSGIYFESEYYLIITYFLPNKKQSKLNNLIYKEKKDIEIYNLEEEKFLKTVDDIKLGLKDFVSQIEDMNIDEMLTFLHSSCSLKDHYVKSMGDLVELDSYISDTTITVGETLKLNGTHYVGLISLLSYPDETWTGMFDIINKLSIEYKWTMRFIFQDDNKAVVEGKDRAKHFHNEKKGILAGILERKLEVHAEESREKELREEECNNYVLDIENGAVKSGYYTFVLTLINEDKRKLEDDMKLIEKEINKLGFTTVQEKVNSLEVFVSTLAGNVEYNIRRPILHTGNYIDLIPLGADWDGDKINKHFNQEALLYAESGLGSSFKFNLHIGDIGHTLILGPTGAGKSVLLATLAYQWRKYKDNQVIIFDKDSSSRVLTAGVGGKFFDIGVDQIAFQPLRNIDDERELEWVYDWLLDILVAEGLEIQSEHKKSLLQSLKLVASMDKEDRTITQLLLQEQNKDIRNILERYTNGENGVYGRYFDNNYDDFNAVNTWQVFEMGALFNTKIMQPVLSYLFHKLEIEMFNGKKTLLVLDECWLMLQNGIFSSKMLEWLKTLRKKNVSVVFATQQLSDIVKSSIKEAIFESCLTKVYLPNREALSSDLFKDIYKEFGLNDTELHIIKNGKMKRDYYYKSQKGGKLFRLNLNELELAYVGASTPDEQNKCKEILKEVVTTDEFNKKWQEYKQVSYEEY